MYIIDSFLEYFRLLGLMEYFKNVQFLMRTIHFLAHLNYM